MLNDYREQSDIIVVDTLRMIQGNFGCHGPGGFKEDL